MLLSEKSKCEKAAIIYFQLYEVLEKAELWILGLGGSGQEEEYTEHRRVLGQWKYSWLNYNMTYTL